MEFKIRRQVCQQAVDPASSMAAHSPENQHMGTQSLHIPFITIYCCFLQHFIHDHCIIYPKYKILIAIKWVGFADNFVVRAVIKNETIFMWENDDVEINFNETGRRILL